MRKTATGMLSPSTLIIMEKVGLLYFLPSWNVQYIPFNWAYCRRQITMPIMNKNQLWTHIYF